ncbi:MAG: glutathione S-transferase family protein [Xanthobacteraceae bacterium]|nr:glutathione S-transferase family protein [Xanthobacteraceae bacterium]
MASELMKVWGRRNSINVQKVLWCCRELGLSPQHIFVGGEFGGTQEPDYVAMNPNRLVPTLEDDGFVLWESNVIVRYLAQKFKVGGLCPQDIRSRFDCERWMDWQATTLWPALRPVFIGIIRTPKEEFNSRTQKEDEAKCAAVLSLLDERLSNRPFVGGDDFSMADIPVGASVYRWYALDITHPHLPSLRRWYDALTERPAFQSEVMLPLS